MCSSGSSVSNPSAIKCNPPLNIYLVQGHCCATLDLHVHHQTSTATSQAECKTWRDGMEEDQRCWRWILKLDTQIYLWWPRYRASWCGTSARFVVGCSNPMVKLCHTVGVQVSALCTDLSAQVATVTTSPSVRVAVQTVLKVVCQFFCCCVPCRRRQSLCVVLQMQHLKSVWTEDTSVEIRLESHFKSPPRVVWIPLPDQIWSESFEMWDGSITADFIVRITCKCNKKCSKRWWIWPENAVIYAVVTVLHSAPYRHKAATPTMTVWSSWLITALHLYSRQKHTAGGVLSKARHDPPKPSAHWPFCLDYVVRCLSSKHLSDEVCKRRVSGQSSLWVI